MNVRYRVPVWYCVPVECTIVTTGSPVSRRFLGYHVEGRGPGAGRGSDDTQLEHVLELTLCSLEPFGCESSGANRDGRTSGLNVVTDIVSHGCVWHCDLSEGQELRSAR